MSSRSEIRFNYNQALGHANDLDNLADRLDKIQKKSMENSMQALANAWKGENATSFLTKSGILQQDIKKTAEQIRDIADDIRRIARAVYEAEMAAWRIAQERKS